MKQTTKTSRAAGQLEAMYRALNKRFFNDELPTDSTIITIASSPKSFGHFICSGNAWTIDDKTSGERGAFEINISSGTLDRPIENVCATLCHEMVHQYCYLMNIKDTSNNNVYHNAKFRAEGETRGLQIEYAKTIGWSITNPTEELIDFIVENGFEDIRMGRNEYSGYFVGGGDKAGNPTNKPTLPTLPKKGNSHKLICPCCGVTVRYTTSKTPNIVCGDCNQQMIDC